MKWELYTASMRIASFTPRGVPPVLRSKSPHNEVVARGQRGLSGVERETTIQLRLGQNTDVIDLRSDTVTRPTAAMRKAMYEAEVGDDVYNDDPTVARLEHITAELLDKPAAMFVSSGTQSNLCALLSHCDRGDEYIVGQHAHTYRYEAGGAAVLGSIQPQPLDFEADGSLDLDAVRDAVKPDDPHFARTKLLCLENTRDGLVVPQEYMERAGSFASDHGLSLHLDGARLWNAAAWHQVEPAELVRPFDSISVCLSKGMGAPIGSVLVGSDGLIAEARRYRKMLGGAMRQVGVIAAASIFAIEHHRYRLVDDHRNAQLLADLLNEIEGVDAAYDDAQTNMVFVEFERDVAHLAERLLAEGVTATIRTLSSGGAARLVTHLDVSTDDVEAAAKAIAVAY